MGAALWITPTSNDVPPRSVVMMLGVFMSVPRNTEPVTPATGPESKVSKGASWALRTVMVPPAHCVICSGGFRPVAFNCLSRRVT